MPGNTPIPQNTPTAAPTSAGLDPNIIAFAKAIRDNETGGSASPYTQAGKSGEYGAYQITQPLWDGFASKYGITTPLQQSSPEEQNKFVYNRISELKAAGYNPGEIASIWNHGSPDPTGAVGVNSYGASYNTPQYVDNVYNSYMKYKNAMQTNTDPQTGLPTYGALFPYTQGDNPLVAGAKAVGNLPSSIYGFGKGIADMVFHPVQTLQNLGGVAIGGIEELTHSPSDQNTQTFDSFVNALKQRYGSVNALTNTAVNDPFGFGADIAGILEGGAGAAGLTDELHNIGSRVGQSALTPIMGATDKLSPIKSVLDTQAIESAARLGTSELPASAQNASPTAALFEALASKGLGGQGIVDRAATAASSLIDSADSIVSAAGGTEDLASAGQTLAEGLNSFIKKYRQETNAIYDSFASKAGDLTAQTSHTVDAINAILDNKERIGDTTDSSVFQNMLDALTGKKTSAKTTKGALPLIDAGASGGKPTFTTLKQMRTRLGERLSNSFGDTFVTANKAQLKQVYGALTQDMRSTIKATRDKSLLKELDSANAAYSAGRQVITSNVIKQIQRFTKAQQYDKILPALLRPSMSMNDIKTVMQLTGDAGAAQVRTSFLKQIFDASKGADGAFTPTGLTRQLKKFGDKAQAILTPEQFQSVTDIENVAKALGRSKTIEKGSQTAFLLHQFATLGLAGWAFVDLLSGNPMGFMQRMGLIGMDYAGSKILASRLGQDVLTYGIANGLKVRLGIAELNREGLKAPEMSGQVPNLTQSSTSNTIEEPSVAQQATDLTKANGGVTINTAGEQPTTGFVYAQDKSTERIIPAAEFNQSHTEQFMADHADALAKPGNYLGVWQDGDKIYLDVSTVEPDMQKALEGANNAQQLGVYDLSKGETITTEYGKKANSTGGHEGQDSGAGTPGSTGEAQGQGQEAAAKDAGVALTPEQQKLADSIPRDKTLTGEDANVQEASIHKYVTQKDQLLKDYIAQNGNWVSADLARPLFKDIGYDGNNTAAVQEASSALSKDALAYWIKNSGDKKDAYFLAGGSGAGKSTATRAMGDATKNAAFVLDGNLSNYASAMKKIQATMDGGKMPTVLYVYRDPIEAWKNGVISRMLTSEHPEEYGRVVPLRAFLENTSGALDTVKKILTDNKDVPVKAYENLATGGKKTLSMSEVENLSMPNVTRKLVKYTEGLAKDGTITKDQYEALLDGYKHAAYEDLQK